MALKAEAASPDDVRLNLGQEYTECLVYYQFGAFAAQKAGKLEMTKQGMKFANDDLKMALMLLPPKFVKADTELATKYEAGILKNEGFARLILMYADICKEGLEHPKARIRYW